MVDVQRRALGRTGVTVSCIGVGGAHLTSPGVDEKTAIGIVRKALDAGIDFLDNSWDYGKNGQAEKRMGKALKAGYRERAFLMTKIDGRSRREAAKQLDESLARFDVDMIDLVQHHEVIRYEDVDRIFHDDGANRALLDARDAGKIRFIGFTGHKDPAIHLRMLDVARANDMRFDAVQMPLNVMDAHFRSFERLVLPELVNDGIAVLGMKSMGSGVILKSGTVSPKDCLRYALSLPTSVVITGIDSKKILDQAIDMARHFVPLTPEERGDLLRRTVDAAADGKYEMFKTTTVFDATTQNPHWLGAEPKVVKEMAP